jgi:tetratricopeptide (TPR) repeat protein
MNINIFMVVICLLVASIPYVDASYPSIKVLSLTVGGELMRTYENLAYDSLLEVDIQDGKEVQVVIIAELSSKMVIVHSGLCNSLLSYEGAEALKKEGSDLMLKVTSPKLVLRAYGTFNRAKGSTILLVLLDDLNPLLIIRSKSIELSEELMKLKQMLNKVSIPPSRKSYYENLLLKAEKAYAEGRQEAIEVTSKALEELEREGREYSEAKLLIDEATNILTNNLARLPSERRLEAETKLKLALLNLEGAKYEEARKYAAEALNLAMWTIWDELKTMLPIIAIIAMIAIIGIAIAILVLHFKPKAEEKAIPKEVYGE